MESNEMLSRVTDIMRKIASNQNLSIDTETKFQEIEDWDSLNTVDMEMELESVFSTNFEIGEFRELESVGELLNCLREKLA